MLSANTQLAISGLTKAFCLVVAAIEHSVPTTQNHYGHYMLCLSQTIERARIVGKDQDIPVGDKEEEKVALASAIALIEAGANRKGVLSALTALGYDITDY